MGLYLATGYVSKVLTYHFIVILILLIGVSLFICINVKKRTKAENETKEAKQKLEQSYIELGEAYQQVKITQKELAARFEELKRSEERNKKLAYTDYITDLPNRTAFSEKMDDILSNVADNETIAIMYIDLDNFKNVNDILGHSYGDELLVDVTGRIKQVLEEEDFIARFGGDEFIILSRHVKDKETYENKIKQIYKMFSYPFLLSMREFFVTMSIGIAFVPFDGDSTQIILRNVDAAMYAAKALGKNTYCFYDKSLNYNLMCKIELQSELRMAILNKEFEVFYQAQIDLKQDRIVGFEALIRWHHPVKGLIPPAEFVKAAEETGQIIDIGKWVLYEACRQLKKWEDAGFYNLNIAVNLSARQFRDMDLVKMVTEAINETGIEANRLELEITESIALENIDYSVQVIKELKKMGVQFSLDDFGTGYSSMNYLKYLPVNNLKIDKSFLDTVLENRSDRKIVSAIITLAQTLDLVVIAEGVENNEQAMFLKTANCNKAQGYLYSKPVPAGQADKILGKMKQYCNNNGMTLENIL